MDSTVHLAEKIAKRLGEVVIADQLRFWWRSLQEVHLREEEMAELRALLSRRRDLVQNKTRQITRLRATLLEIFRNRHTGGGIEQ